MKRSDLTGVGLFVLAAAAILLLPRFVSDFRAQQFAYVGIYFIALLGLNVLTGYTGLISLGHGAFMAIGGYTTASTTNERTGTSVRRRLIRVAPPSCRRSRSA